MNWKNIFKIAGAFVACVIGSGFATGQEVLQFFSSYGTMSFAVIALDLAGFILLGYFLMKAGFEHRSDESFDHFCYFCGDKLGSVYRRLVSLTVLLIIPVLFSGGGAALEEYYRVPKALGSAVMAVLVLTVYLAGFERMVDVVSKIGPVVVCFTLAVGLVALFRDFGNWDEIAAYEPLLKDSRAAPTWWLSGLLYMGVNFFPASTYFTRLGYSLNSKKEVRAGAVLGGGTLLLAIGVISTAILLNAGEAAGLSVPVLYLARRIASVIGAVFSVVLILGIFSSCTVLMWTFCGRFAAEKKKNTLVAVGVAVFAYVLSLFSFGGLIGTVYPIIGYIALLFLGCVVWKGGRKVPERSEKL